MNFSDLQLDSRIVEAIDIMRFTECTPIQEQSIPPLLEGRDLIGIAQTGTGKTWFCFHLSLFFNSYFQVSQVQELKKLKELSLPTVAEELRQ